MDKIWDPLVFNRVLDNWDKSPFVEIIIKDFTGEQYDKYWQRDFTDKEESIRLEESLKCPENFEEIGKGYWYGLEDGCLCNGEFGGSYNTDSDPSLKIPPLTAG